MKRIIQKKYNTELRKYVYEMVTEQGEVLKSTTSEKDLLNLLFDMFGDWRVTKCGNEEAKSKKKNS